MKIIGETENTYVVEMKKDEFTHLCGFSYSNNDFEKFLQSHGALEEKSFGHKKVRFGVEIPIGEWWRSLESLRYQFGRVVDMVASIRGLADAAETSVKVFKDQITPEPETKKKK